MILGLQKDKKALVLLLQYNAVLTFIYADSFLKAAPATFGAPQLYPTIPDMYQRLLPIQKTATAAEDYHFRPWLALASTFFVIWPHQPQEGSLYIGAKV